MYIYVCIKLCVVRIQKMTDKIVVKVPKKILSAFTHEKAFLHLIHFVSTKCLWSHILVI